MRFRYASISSRCSSRLCAGVTPGLLELALDRLRDLGELAEDVDRRIGIARRLEARTRLLEPLQQLLRPPERFLGRAHARPSPATAPDRRSRSPPPPGAAACTVLSRPVLRILCPPAPHPQQRLRNARAPSRGTDITPPSP